MAEVNLSNRKIEVLKVIIGDKSYSLPLGGSVPYKTLKTINTDKGMMAFLGEHIPQDVVDALTVDEIRQIFSAWAEETKKSTGLMPGES